MPELFPQELINKGTAAERETIGALKKLIYEKAAVTLYKYQNRSE